MGEVPAKVLHHLIVRYLKLMTLSRGIQTSTMLFIIDPTMQCVSVFLNPKSKTQAPLKILFRCRNDKMKTMHALRERPILTKKKCSFL